MKKMVCDIYRCNKKEGMYIYVEKGKDIETLSVVLTQRTGRMSLAMTIVLTPDKKLANAKAADVIAVIENQAFYLQMPPTISDEMQSVSQANTFIKR